MSAPQLPAAVPVKGVPGLWAAVLFMMDVPEAATTLVVGSDPADPYQVDSRELAARYAAWDAKWSPLANARALARRRQQEGDGR